MKIKLLIYTAIAVLLISTLAWKPNPESMRTSLLAAVRADDAQTAIRLIQKGADANSRTSSNGWSALHYAVRNGDVEMVQALLNAGADPNYYGTMEGQTTPIISERPLVLAQAAQDLASQVTPTNMEATLRQGGLDDPALLKSMKDPVAADRYQKVVDLLAKVTKEN
ncbi:MAG: ankyrin repeat domain-containing protein [Terracidiphilus sp.]|jgi:ankyrin repeat protein